MNEDFHAGASLDKLVAEYVLKWRYEAVFDPETKTNSKKLLPPNFDMLCKEAGENLKIRIPAFSTCPGDALAVVDALKHHPYAAQERFYLLYDGFNFQKVIDGQKIKPVRIDPLEICIAALKAVGAIN